MFDKPTRSPASHDITNFQAVDQPGRKSGLDIMLKGEFRSQKDRSRAP